MAIFISKGLAYFANKFLLVYLHLHSGAVPFHVPLEVQRREENPDIT